MLQKPEKLAVVLLNLGGPLAEKDIKPFLFNFFMDKNIVSAPLPMRYLIAQWIAWNRGRGAAKEAYGLLGGKSPLLENTLAQAEALELSLKGEYAEVKVFTVMRYWHPFAKEVIRGVLAYRPDRIVLLPLYPQYSTTTSFSAIQNWQHQARRAGLDIPTAVTCCYPTNAGFIGASIGLIQAALKEAPPKIRLLFSAHGLPEKTISAGDPYQGHCEQTAAAIVKKLDMPTLDWQICYQSRVGSLKWIGPSTEEALEKAAEDNVGVVIYPLAFVSEHVETLVEIDIEYRHRAQELGIPYFAKVPTVGVHPLFITGLSELVSTRASGAECARTCPPEFKKCYCGVKNG